MKNLMTMLKKLHRDEAGAMSVEQVLILALVAVPIIVGVMLFKDKIKSWFTGQTDKLKDDTGGWVN